VMYACSTHVRRCIVRTASLASHSPTDAGQGIETTTCTLLSRVSSISDARGFAVRDPLFSPATLVLVTLFCVRTSAGQEKRTPNGVQHQPQIVNSMPLAEVRQNATHGDARAQFILGKAYFTGSGVAQDYGEAARWYAAASAQNLADAQVSLGNLYEQGKGVAKDYREAFHYYRAAALQGEPTAENNLASLYEHGQGTTRNPKEAFDWYLASAVAGNPIGQCNLASMYFVGRGIRRDYEQAARWFRAAAEQGIPEAQNLLAVMYYKGDGVSRNYAEAANWARRAAEQGYPPAQTDLAYMYEQGKGVPLDYVAAYTWHSVAAAAGERHSAARLKNLAHLMLPEQVRTAKAHAAEWAQQHAASGHAPANETSDSLTMLPRN
jgi:uncharacterized protein